MNNLTGRVPAGRPKRRLGKGSGIWPAVRRIRVSEITGCFGKKVRDLLNLIRVIPA